MTLLGRIESVVARSEFRVHAAPDRLKAEALDEFNDELGSGARAWYLQPMSTITVPLPDEDFAFLRNFSAAQGTSAEAFLARQARNLREHLQRPLRPEVLRATGIISPEVAGEAAHREHLEKKHA